MTNKGPFARVVGGPIDLVAARHLAFWLEVGQKREVQVAIPRESEMGPNAVDGDADQLRVVTLKLRQQLLIENELIGTHRAPVLRIEHEDDRPATKLRERNRLIRRRRKRELGRTAARRQRRSKLLAVHVNAH